MAFIRLPLGIRVAMEYELFGKTIVNVYHITALDPIDTAKLLIATTVFRDWWIADLNVMCSAEIALTTVTALNLDEANGEKQTTVVSPVEPGGNPDDAVSANVALVASFATARTGRSFRGRSYLAGISEPQINQNNVGEAFQTLLVTIYANLVVALAVPSMTLVVASFQSGGVPRGEGVATPVASISVNTRVDTQRRRLPA